ncbi:hypothetical protein N7510_004924 [Penicillium lagena]|uniref:uncharacterized protein n=1 Tax=Penicillium lagena TaxID=94218 RepID=UPI0025405E05|nr:uncharacterized protein N7510_004924 [Penicillium lagena]KAJ5620940.1 hypothetical protein N7510_004924 [Penicillium lagena]
MTGFNSRNLAKRGSKHARPLQQGDLVFLQSSESQPFASIHPMGLTFFITGSSKRLYSVFECLISGDHKEVSCAVNAGDCRGI